MSTKTSILINDGNADTTEQKLELSLKIHTSSDAIRSTSNSNSHSRTTNVNNNRKRSKKKKKNNKIIATTTVSDNDDDDDDTTNFTIPKARGSLIKHKPISQNCFDRLKNDCIQCCCNRNSNSNSSNYNSVKIKGNNNSNSNKSKRHKKKRKKRTKKENRPKKITILFLKLIQRSFSMLDLFTDIALLYVYREDELIFGFVLLFLSICSPYLISYSSGVKLFMLRGTFENAQGFFKIITNLFLSPVGILYFVFLDFLDAFLVFVDLVSMVIFRMNENQLRQRQRLWAKQIGMDRMAWVCVL